MIHATRIWALVMGSLLALGSPGCDANEESGPAAGVDADARASDAQDGSVADRQGEPDGGTAGLNVAIGTGEPGVFLPAVDGATFELQRGCQGSQHIFTSVRVSGASGSYARVGVQIVRVDDGAPVSVPLDVRLPFEVDLLSDRVRRVTGLTPVIEVPGDVLERAVEVRVIVFDERGESAQATMRGMVRWGADSCGAHG